MGRANVYYPCPECGSRDQWFFEEVRGDYGTIDIEYLHCYKCSNTFPKGMFEYRCWFDYHDDPKGPQYGQDLYGYIDGFRNYIGHTSNKKNAQKWGDEWKDTQIKMHPRLRGMRHWPGDKMYRIRTIDRNTKELVKDSDNMFIKEEALGVIKSLHMKRRKQRKPHVYDYELVHIGILNEKGEIE